MEVKIPVWGVCPFRSPVLLPPDDAPAPRVFAPQARANDPKSILGPCLYAGCGLWKVTKVVDGQPVDGMCSLRFAAEAMNSLAASLETLVKISSPSLNPNGSA